MSFRTFTLEPDNVCNMSLRDEDLKVLYTTETVFPGSKTLTHIRNGDDEIIATLEWRDILSDKVTIGTKEKITLSSWLKKSTMPFTHTATFKDDAGQSYRWEGNGPGLQLQLFAEDSSSKEPIARFVKSHEGNSPKVPATPAQLHISPRGLEIRDLVVLSFIFLEKSRRMNENSNQARADVLGTPGITLPGFQAIQNGGV